MSGDHPPLIKICGVCTSDDARMVSAAGADWIGINFHPASKRYVPPDQAPGLVAAMAGLSEPVGLFVDRSPAEVRREAERAGIRIVQLHGDEPAEVVSELRSDGYQVIRAFRLGDRRAVDRMESWLDRAAGLGGMPDYVLVDAFVPGQAGGTGHAIADGVLDLLVDRLSSSARVASEAGTDEASPKFILAGGLTPGNVAGLVARVRPWMVDVASGVERSPGVKDRDLVSAFVRAAGTP